MLKDLHKRNFIKAVAASSFLPAFAATELKAEQINSSGRVNIVLSRDYAPSLTPRDKYRLVCATIDFIKKKYHNRNLPVWGKRFEEIDLEKRVESIVEWIATGIEKYRDIYPVDPVWLVAQIMIESFFYEFTVSSALAAGVCQFIKPTAHEYGMLCASDLPEHSKSPYKLIEYAGEADRYYQLLKNKRRYRRHSRPGKLTFQECLEIIAQNKCSGKMKHAGQYLQYEKKLDEFDKKMKTAKNRYREYIRANTKDKNIFRDAAFFEQFDERLTHSKSVPAMVKMMARNLRARNGNILAAAAGYQAGLSRTRDTGVYKTYGRIPYIQSSVYYLSHIIVVHNEISAGIEKL